MVQKKADDGFLWFCLFFISCLVCGFYYRGNLKQKKIKALKKNYNDYDIKFGLTHKLICFDQTEISTFLFKKKKSNYVIKFFLLPI